MAAPFNRVAVVGTGLVGGSFALAFKDAFPQVHLIGWDRPEVLALARERGAIDEAAVDLAAACSADLVYIALPVEESIRCLPAIAAAVSAESLVTDAGSTKSLVCRAARQAFSSPRQFIGGHPIAGREQGGIENADAGLFRGAAYVLAGNEKDAGEGGARLTAVLQAIGARPLWLEPADHDRLIAYLSHLPQLAAIALAKTVLEGAGESSRTLAGSGLRDSCRLAGSPYNLWAEICRTSPDLDAALAHLISALEQIRGRLHSSELAEDFDRASLLYKILRGME